MKLFAFIAITALVSPAAWAGVAVPLFKADSFDGRVTPLAQDKAANRFEARSRLLQLLPANFPRARGEHSVLNLFTNGVFEVVWDDITENQPANHSWCGHLTDDPFSAVTMTVVDDAMALDVVSQKYGRFIVHRQADGTHRAFELDTEAMKQNTNDFVVAQAGTNWQTAPAASPAVPAADAQGYAPVTIDVLVVYTHSALVNAGSRAALVAMAQNAVAAENGTFSRSQVVHSLRLVHTHEVTTFDGSGNLGTDLGVVGSSSEVASLRNLVGADLVALFSYPDNTGTLGIANELLNTNGDQTAAFTANAWGTASGVWPHECGHNLGCAHNTADVGLYPYSHGYYWTDSGGTVRGTIMSYVGARIGWFSNPNVTYGGDAIGLLNTNENWRDINNAGPLVAAYRAAKLLMDASVGLTSSSASPAENSNFQITVNVTNAGPTIASNIQVSVTLPSGIAYIADDGAGGFSSGTGLWNVPILAASANATLQLTLRPNAGTAGATLPVTATVSSVGSACVDFDYYNNFATNNIVPSPDAALSFVWTNQLGGNWSVAGNWSNNLAPIVGGSNNYAFSLVGTQPFVSTNNLAGNLVLNRLTLDVSSNASSTLAGNPLQFAVSSFGTAPEVRQADLGAWGISNNVTLAADTTFNATGSGAVTIVGNVSGSGALIKFGSNPLTLKGNNSYTGATMIQGGTFSVSSAAALAGTTKVSVGSGGVFSFNSVNNGQAFSTPLELVGTGAGNGAFYTYVEGGSLTWNGAINLMGSTLLQAYAGSSTVFLNGAIGDLTGGSDVTFLASGASTTHKDYFVLSGASTYGGDTILDNYAASCEVKLSGGVNRLPATTVLYLLSGHWNAAMISALDLNGNNQTLAGLADGAYTSGARRIVNTSAVAATLTVNNAADFTFGGTLGGNDLAGVAGNNFAFTKNGSGKLTLNGAAQHSGATTVNAGTLVVNGNLNPSALTATAATLGGTGFVRSAILNSGATLKPGSAVGAGTLIFSNLTCATGSTLAFDLTNALTVGGVNDLVLVTNAIFTGTTAISVNPLAPLAAGRYVLVRCSGTLSGTGNLSLLPPLAGSRYQPALDFSMPNEVGLLITNGAAAGSLTWKGSSTNTTWDLSLTTNWQNGGASPDIFYNADSVTFDDTGISSQSINLVGSLAPAVFTMNSASNYTFSGIGSLTGPVSPVVTGAGTWTIANSNNFSGGTLSVQSGTVSLNYNSSSSGPELNGLGAVAVSSGATLRAVHPNNASSVTFANVPLTLTGSGSGSYNGALKFDNGLVLSSVWPGAITLAGATTIHNYGVTITTRLNGVIGGSGPLTLAGRGGNSASHTSTFYLGAQNNYSGDTQLQNNDGLLDIMVRAATNNAVPSTSALALGGVGSGKYVTFDLNGFSQQVAGLYTTGGSAVKRIMNSNSLPATLTVNCSGNYFFDGVLGSLNATNFSLVKLGAGALALAGSNSLSGAVLVGQGILQLTNGLALPDACPVTISNNSTATLELDNDETIGSLAGGGALNLDAFTLTAGGNGTNAVFSGRIYGTGGLVKKGTNSTWTLSGSNTFSGAVNISEGSLIVKNSSALGSGCKTVALNNGTAGQCALHLDGSAGGLMLGTNLAYNTSWVNGCIVNDVGTNYLQGNISLNSGGGDTGIVVSNGLLALGGSISPVATGRTLRLGGAGSGLVSGTITDSVAFPLASLRKLDGGTWTLSGTNIFTGPTTIEGGLLVMNGSLGTNAVTVFTNATLGGSGLIRGAVTVQNGGTLSPGVGGINTLTVSNNLTLNSGSTTILEINRALATNDLVRGISTVNFAGTLIVTNFAGTLAAGDVFKLFTANSYVGTFSDLNLPPLPLGLGWTNQLVTSGSIAVISTIPVTPPQLSFQRTNSDSLVISWPTNYAGYYLQCQTGSLTVGLTTNWFPVMGGSNPPLVVPLNGNSPNVFFRLRSP